MPPITPLPKGGLEQALYEQIVKAFFTGVSFYNDQGYAQTIPPPIKNVVDNLIIKLQPEIKEGVLAQIVTDDLVTEILAEVKKEITIAKLKKEVATELKAKLIKKLGGK